MRNAIAAAAVILVVGSEAAAQSSAEEITFNRPEAWALKYFTAATTFTALGPPAERKAWSVEFGLEGGWFPSLSESQRRVGFEGTAVEDLNKLAVFGRPRLALGLPAGFSFELGWVPPIEINGVKANLVAAALERPFFDHGRFALGLRVYGQLGNVKSDFTCPKSAAAQPPGSPGNPLGCNAPSRDTSTLNHAGLAVAAGVNLGAGGALHFAAGGTYNDLEFQVGAVTNGEPDDTRLPTRGWTGWVAAGAGWQLCDRVSLAAEAYYSPLRVRRPPSQETQNDALFNVRAMLRYRIR